MRKFIKNKKIRELLFGKDIYQVKPSASKELTMDYSEQLTGYHKPQGFDSNGRPLGFGLGNMRYTDDDSKLTPEYKRYRDKSIKQANDKIKITPFIEDSKMTPFEYYL